MTTITGKNILEPSSTLTTASPGEWVSLDERDPVARHLASIHPDLSDKQPSWVAARGSHAVYFYRESTTGWTAVAKFYAVKTGSNADKYASRELDGLLTASRIGLDAGPERAVRPLGVWRGVLLLEYVDGLTLEDLIAVRRSRPGSLKPGLAAVSRLLAKLHKGGLSQETIATFESAVQHTDKIITTLSQHGVLKQDPLTEEGLRRVIGRWRDDPAMRSFPPTLTHGDATTSNFIFPAGGQGVVAIDWERHGMADPASDLGRLFAEVTHSITRTGGSTAEALPLIQYLSDTYRQALHPVLDPAPLLSRTRFYQAESTLRIARNGWLSRLERTALVAQAFALLV